MGRKRKVDTAALDQVDWSVLSEPGLEEHVNNAMTRMENMRLGAPYPMDREDVRQEIYLWCGVNHLVVRRMLREGEDLGLRIRDDLRYTLNAYDAKVGKDVPLDHLEGEYEEEGFDDV